MAAVRSINQLALDETVINDPTLESALEERLASRIAMAEVRRSVKEADEAADKEVEKLELPEGAAVRCGRFRITRQHIPARSVSFETSATSRVSISVIDEGE